MFRLRKRARSSRIGSRSITSMISRVQQDFYCLYKDSTTPHPDPPPAGEGESAGEGGRKAAGEGEEVASSPTPTLPLRGREKSCGGGRKLRGREWLGGENSGTDKLRTYIAGARRCGSGELLVVREGHD